MHHLTIWHILILAAIAPVFIPSRAWRKEVRT